MELSGIVRNELLLNGINFVEEFGAFQMTMTSGRRCWRCIIFTVENELVCCSQFPWKTSAAALSVLGQLNSEACLGCFLLKDSRVLYRCGAVVSDPLEVGETLISLLRLNGNTVCRFWERVKSCGG